MALCRRKSTTLRVFFFLCLGVVCLVLLSVAVLVPLAFRWFPQPMRSFIFVPNKEVPENNDYHHPENYGFIGGRNFYLKTMDGAKLGVWHTLPSDLEDAGKAITWAADNSSALQVYDSWLSDSTVFLYLHGSAGTRTSNHRLHVYRLLNDLGYHVITFDYRGYGDSSSSPESEYDLIQDTLKVFDWIHERVTKGTIFIWGHSLGTGVAAHAADAIFWTYGREVVKGIVLEAPFNNMASMFRASSILHSVSFLPWFDYCFIEPLGIHDLSFKSDEHLKNISTPTLILHAEDDKVVPIRFAKELFAVVSNYREDSNTVQIVRFNSYLGYGHYNISLDPNLNTTIREYVQNCTAST